MHRIACVAAIALVAAPAYADLPASPSVLEDDLARLSRGSRVFDFEDVDIGVEVTLGLEPGDADLLRTNPTNPRIIDLDRAHRRDCALDRIRGGQCVLRGLDGELDVRIDVVGYGRGRAQQGRFELLDRILESADVVP